MVKKIVNYTGIICYCNNCPGNRDAENGTCPLAFGGQCFSAIEQVYFKEDNSYENVRTFGCFSASDQALLQCRGDLVPSYNLRSIQCCNFTDLCNQNLLPQLKIRNIIPPPNIFMQSNIHLLTLLLSFIFGFIIIFAYIAFAYKRCKRHSGSRMYFTEPFSIKLHKSQHVLQDLVTSSGSGAGKPLLIQTTIGRQFKRINCLGQGRFTEIYVGEWNASKIVEKIFSSAEEGRWFREKDIYETVSLRHENVLGYISSDILPNGMRAIYTDYHEFGSLCDYLDKTNLCRSEFLILVRTAVTAVAHLHTEIFATLKHPAVAHRDITSKNFFINDNKQCVISNFEISIKHTSMDDVMNTEPDITLGTPRYMAPEIVTGTINVRSFAAFKMADIYSLGLVLYEICQRCVTIENNSFVVDEHTLPFFDVLPKNPLIDDMRKLFGTKNPREDLLMIPSRWKNNDFVLKSFTSIMQECFYVNPKARPNVLRLKKSIIALENQDAL